MKLIMKSICSLRGSSGLACNLHTDNEVHSDDDQC
jgi:hypothetical protein